MNEEYQSLYAPPSYITSEGDLNTGIDDKITSWHSQELEKSKNFLRGQRGFRTADICMGILYGDEAVRIPSKLSVITIKKLRRQAREAIANASNIRPRWKTKTFKNKYAEIAQIRNKLRDWWFYALFVDRYIKESLQYAAGGGTGYLMLWPEMDHCSGQLEIQPKSLSYKNVFPFHAGLDARIENIYGVSAWFEMPLPEAHEKWPEHIGIIKADRDIPSYFAKGFEKAKKTWRGAYDWITNNKSKNSEWAPYPVADIYFTWVRDNAINKSGHTIRMGDPDAHFSYSVPSLYDVSGVVNKRYNGEIINSADARYGLPSAIKLTRKECKLFPYRRFMITTNFGVIYDGPPIWITRRPPITSFKFEELVGEFLGISLIRDGRGLERSANNMTRAIEDSVVGRLQPPIGIDQNLPDPIKSKLAGNVRLLIGMVFKYNTQLLSKALVTLLPSDYFNVDPNAFPFIKFLHEMSDYLMGTADFSSWQRLKQLPASDTQESMLQNLGMLATDHERTIERSLMEMAEIFEDLAPQVYTQDRIITYLGADGISEESWDFEANSLIPKLEAGDNRSYAQRLQEHMRVFSLYASPHSIQERMSVTNKLTLAQLRKLDVPISDEKMYNTFLDDGEYELSLKQFNAERQAKILQAAMLQKKLAEANQEADPHNQLTNHLTDLIRGDGKGAGGRPANNSTPPRLEQKKDQDGVDRSTIATN